MTPPACSPYRDEILGHFLDGRVLSAEARKHYSGCVHCMTAATSLLSRNVAGVSEQVSVTERMVGAFGTVYKAPDRGDDGTEPAALPEPARRALEHGREVLDREFGVRSRRSPSPSGTANGAEGKWH